MIRIIITVFCLSMVLVTSVSSQRIPDKIITAPEPLLTPQKAVPLLQNPFWETSELNVTTTGMIWRDCNNDGFIDAFFSNGNDITLSSNYIYFSRFGSFLSSAGWYSNNAEYSGHCAVGDIDDNGYPDFVVSNYLGAGGFGDYNRSNVYFNTNGFPEGSPSWISADEYYSFSCALGDVDNDGDLDLAVATGDAYTSDFMPDRIYFNENGTLQSLPGWQSSINTAAMDVTWGDVDNDGDLDLAFCTDAEGALLYNNNNGAIESSPSWQSSHSEPANTIIFGDVNSDGWLDLIVAFNSQLGTGGYFRLYLNDGTGNLNTNPDWQSTTNGYGSGVSLYDYDNDGDMDLAAGRWWDEPRVYENSGSTFTNSPVWQANLNTVVEELAWVDIDGDGVENFVDTFNTSDTKLFYVSYNPLYSVDSVVVDGGLLSNSGFCYDLVSGWVSVSQLPVSNVIVYYKYSFKNDLAVSNWDTFNIAYPNTNEPNVLIYADTSFGWAPLTVQLSDSSLSSSNWEWAFDDDSFSSEQNPQHIFSDAGIYNITLDVDLPDGHHSRTVPRMVIALADTLTGADVKGSPGETVELGINLVNNFSLNEIEIPVEYDGSLNLTFSSMSVAGCRTEYFDQTGFKHFDPFNKRMTLYLRASANNSKPELTPGEGVIVKLLFTISSPAVDGDFCDILFDGYDSYSTFIEGSQLGYAPYLNSGRITVECCKGIRGNIDGDILDEINIADLVYFVDYSFGNPTGPEPPCFKEADVDGSEGLDIADIVYLVDYMFGTPQGPEPVICP